MMNNRNFLLSLLLAAPMILVGKTYTINSPSGDIQLKVKIDKTIGYDVNFKGSQLLCDGTVAMEAGDMTVGKTPKVKKAKESKGRENIKPTVPFKFS